ncbi:mechanosensitive ion channel [Granulicella sp. 5B5]|uniref:mechanosensitive ion channel family protein n=1 Tax=Granulicella sp. 5B5 TaxID=1617967 RepID=UPI0015F61C8C|nr:mechanosensitive ion channel domain-containing protein [Granulicella sp. 5B5]QMV18275.1 mechanosensitive ion channel [Granulicella sp. 5B5]
MAGFHFRHGWFFAVFLFCGALVLANLLHFVLFRLVKRQDAAGAMLGWGLQKHLGKPARVIFLLTCVQVALPFVPGVPAWLEKDIKHAVWMLVVLALGWLAVGLVYVVQDYLLRKYDLKAADNIRARSVHTQFQLFRRVTIALVGILTLGAMLWTFNDPQLWHFGSGLLASAGLASLLLAAAAKTTVSNFLAGLQIALTEPIRIDDVVVVAGEWARVEEITSAYVVLKIWDLRRLIVPLSWFIENPFANWTRQSANILTYSYLYLDYMVPVKEVRAQLERVVKAAPQWDGTVVGCQVTNLTAQSMEIRCLMGSADSGQAFDLQCLVREEMMEWVKEKYPEAYPNLRYRAVGEAARESPGQSGPDVPLQKPHAEFAK